MILLRSVFVLALAAISALALLPTVQGNSDGAGGPGGAIAVMPEGQVSRGEYLATAGNCASCHSVPGGKLMAGGLAFETPFGTIYSTNITPDPETGIGRWSERDFRNAMRHGVRADGAHLYPVFPYSAYTQLTDEDIAAIFAYLRSIAPVQRVREENQLTFPFNFRPLMAVWKALFFTPGELVADPAQSATWNRGAYLVEALAHCGECHSPRNLLGGRQRGLAMSGGEYTDRVGSGDYRPWAAPNLTASERGLGLWSQEDLRSYLQTARNAFLESFGPMNEVIMNSTRHLDAADIDAMATYLKSLPAVEAAAGQTPEQRVLGRGRTVYNLHCGTCHLPTGEGDPEMAPRLKAGSLVVQDANPASMINAILYGPEAPQLALPARWRKPMEEFQYLLDDEEIAAVASFVRHSWGNSAGAVTAQQVARQR